MEYVDPTIIDDDNLTVGHARELIAHCTCDDEAAWRALKFLVLAANLLQLPDHVPLFPALEAAAGKLDVSDQKQLAAARAKALAAGRRKMT